MNQAPRNCHMKVTVVINPSAGGMTAQSEAQLRRALVASNVTHAHIVRLDLKHPDRQLHDLVKRRPDLLVVWGGDGTHRTALNAVGHEPNNLVLLPGGTRNLLSRALHGTSDWKEVLAAVLREPAPRVLPAGRIGDEMFYCALLAGAPALFGNARESLRDGDLLGALNGAGKGLWAVEKMQLEVSINGSQGLAGLAPVRTSCLVAIVGSMASNARMEVITMKEADLYTGLDAIWTSFMSGFRGREGMAITPVESFCVTYAGEDGIPTMLDGEPFQPGRQFRAEFVEHGAYCLAARPS